MKVFNIGTGEVNLIMSALADNVELTEQAVKNEMDAAERDNLSYDLAHARTTMVLLKDQSLQHLCEVALSYFWDRVQEQDPEDPDVEYLLDMMGIEYGELVDLFHQAGYEEE